MSRRRAALSKLMLKRSTVVLALVVAGCGTGGAGATGKGGGTSETAPGTGAAVPPAVATTDAGASTAVVVPDVPPAPPPAPVRAGADFAADAALLFRYVACGTATPIEDAALAKVVDKHCAWVAEQRDNYRDKYIEGARAFFDELTPADLPKTVVYPFGGGDLISALVAFPDADEITSISLEQAGDPRRVGALTAKEMASSLGRLRGELGGTLSVGSNTSVNLSSSQRNDLPAQVSSFLLALAFHGFEPVGMRFVRIEPDGSLHYLTDEEIAAIEAAAAAARKGKKRSKGKARKHDWVDPNFSDAFANVEIAYRKAGDPADRVRVHRHFGWNLHDAALAEHPELITHLNGKGKVAGLVKGASYLLWRADFSTIRDYLLGHVAWMLSDSTGIPPSYAKKAGMVQETYGRFTGAFLEGASPRHADDFKALWTKNPKRKLPVRFGYVDAEKNPHLVVTRPR